jgi:hypothetical protein
MPGIFLSEDSFRYAALDIIGSARAMFVFFVALQRHGTVSVDIRDILFSQRRRAFLVGSVHVYLYLSGRNGQSESRCRLWDHGTYSGAPGVVGPYTVMRQTTLSECGEKL